MMNHVNSANKGEDIYENLGELKSYQMTINY